MLRGRDYVEAWLFPACTGRQFDNRDALQLAAARLADPVHAAGRVCREAGALAGWQHVSFQTFYDWQAVTRGSRDNRSCMVIAFS